MSTTCALMSTRPSSNTANRPTGPAPMIKASVSIGMGPLEPSAGMNQVPFAKRWRQRTVGWPAGRLLVFSAGRSRDVVTQRTIGISGIGKALLHAFERVLPSPCHTHGATPARLCAAHHREHVLHLVGRGRTLGAGLGGATAGLDRLLACLGLAVGPGNGRRCFVVGV